MNEYSIVSCVILNELRIILEVVKGNNFDNDKIQKLLMLVGQQQPDYDHTQDKWAKWKRLGCPTTTNALESIHHHINCKIPQKGSFFDKLKNVKTILFNRYETRNVWHGDNFQNYLKKLVKNKSYQQTNIGNCNCGDYVFYSSLYDYKLTPCRHTVDDFITKYPKIILNPFKEFDEKFLIENHIEFQKINDSLPDNWDINTAVCN